jgi:hypothetical protein
MREVLFQLRKDEKLSSVLANMPNSRLNDIFGSTIVNRERGYANDDAISRLNVSAGSL